MKVYEFDAEIKKQEKVNSGYVEFPFEVEKEFGIKVRLRYWQLSTGMSTGDPLLKWGIIVTLLA
ncbi:MAG: hypothetical protein ACYC2T_14755 [Bacillota bacterium]